MRCRIASGSVRVFLGKNSWNDMGKDVLKKEVEGNPPTL
jgi:hypothetical protein